MNVDLITNEHEDNCYKNQNYWNHQTSNNLSRVYSIESLEALLGCICQEIVRKHTKASNKCYLLSTVVNVTELLNMTNFSAPMVNERAPIR